MQKMLMLLLIIMHIVFTASYFINSGIISSPNISGSSSVS